MPSGALPLYSYRPPKQSGQPVLRSVSSTRARLFAGGTYFRARNPGRPGNLISVEVIEFKPPTDPQHDGVCVVVNHVLAYEENVIGDAKVDVLELEMKYDEYVEIDQLDTNTPRARKYSISAQIGATPGSTVELGTFAWSRLFHRPGILSIRLTPGKPVYLSGDKIIIKPRFKVHRLEVKTDTPEDPPDSPTTFGWDPAALRAVVNAENEWIEMKDRSGPIDDGMGGLPITNPFPPDVQDPGVDETFLVPFDLTFHSGGDGLPAFPNEETTGPSRSLVFVNYGELDNGTYGEHNVVYEWVGSTAQEGNWRPY